MAKKSAVDRAIEALDAEMAVLQAAKERLVLQRIDKGARKPRIVKAAQG